MVVVRAFISSWEVGFEVDAGIGYLGINRHVHCNGAHIPSMNIRIIFFGMIFVR